MRSRGNLARCHYPVFLSVVGARVDKRRSFLSCEETSKLRPSRAPIPVNLIPGAAACAGAALRGRVVVWVSVLRVFAFTLFFVLLAVARGHAQTLPPPPASPAGPPPSTGLMPPYEITSIVRSAGFDPLAPPLREGTTYVLRATDFRGILMRVVVDAHSGAIRAVNRIVPGPGFSGRVGMVPPPYGAADFGDPEMMPDAAGILAPPPMARNTVRPPAVVFPPLPRPRPAMLALRNEGDEASSSTATTAAAPVVQPNAKATDVTSTATRAAPVAPNKVPAVAPLND